MIVRRSCCACSVVMSVHYIIYVDDTKKLADVDGTVKPVIKWKEEGST